MDRQQLLDRLDYDQEKGIFRWKENQRGKAKAGDVAGTTRADGYVKIKIHGRPMFAHRLVWLVETGSMPQHMIDHIDGNPSNNRFSNLRDVPAAMNSQNIRKRDGRDKYSKLLGAHWNKRWNRWKSAINVDGKVIHLGWFDTEQQAHEAYISAKKLHHPGFVGVK